MFLVFYRIKYPLSSGPALRRSPGWQEFTEKSLDLWLWWR